MSHAAEPDELLEIPGNELRPVVGDDPREGLRKLLPRPLANDLDVGFGHRLADLPVHQEPAVPVQHAAQVVEGPGEIDKEMSICQCW